MGKRQFVSPLAQRSAALAEMFKTAGSQLATLTA